MSVEPGGKVRSYQFSWAEQSGMREDPSMATPAGYLHPSPALTFLLTFLTLPPSDPHLPPSPRLSFIWQLHCSLSLSLLPLSIIVSYLSLSFVCYLCFILFVSSYFHSIPFLSFVLNLSFSLFFVLLDYFFFSLFLFSPFPLFISWLIPSSPIFYLGLL